MNPARATKREVSPPQPAATPTPAKIQTQVWHEFEQPQPPCPKCRSSDTRIVGTRDLHRRMKCNECEHPFKVPRQFHTLPGAAREESSPGQLPIEPTEISRRKEPR